MFISLLLSSTFVLLAGMCIAALARLRHHREWDAVRYLFGFNTPSLATSSNIGSALSVTMVFAGFIPAIAGWGIWVIPAVVMGPVVGSFLFVACIRHIRPSKSVQTLTDLVNFPLMHVAQLFLYFLTITSELAVARMIIDHLWLESYTNSLLVIGLLTALCAAYVSLGGYIGVLDTDLFQLMIILVSYGYCLASFWSPSVTLLQDVDSLVRLSGVNLPVIIASFVISAIYYFSLPDVWVRNVGTLRVPDQTLNFLPLRLGVIGFVLVLLPLALIGLAIISTQGRLNQSMNIASEMTFLVQSFADLDLFERYSSVLWWIFGAFVCVVITSVDTQLMGFTQHAQKLRPLKVAAEIGLLPFVVAFLAFLASMLVHNTNAIWALGLLAMVVVLRNALALFQLAVVVQSSDSHFNNLKQYYVISMAMTLVLIALWFDSLPEDGMRLVVVQFAVATTVAVFNFIKHASDNR